MKLKTIVHSICSIRRRISFNKSTWPQRAVEYYNKHIKDDPWKASTSWSDTGKRYTCGADPYRNVDDVTYHWPLGKGILEQVRDSNYVEYSKMPPVTGESIKEACRRALEQYINPVIETDRAGAKMFHEAMKRAAAADYPTPIEHDKNKAYDYYYDQYKEALEKRVAKDRAEVNEKGTVFSKEAIEKLEKEHPGFIQSAIQSGDIKPSDMHPSLKDKDRLYFTKDVSEDTDRHKPFHIYTNKPIAKYNSKGIEHKIVTSCGDEFRMINDNSYSDGYTWVMYCANTNIGYAAAVSKGDEFVLKEV